MDYGLEVRREKKQKGKKVKEEGGEKLKLWVYRVAVGGAKVGDKVKVEEGREVEVRVVGRNEYYEPRQGCTFDWGFPISFLFLLCLGGTVLTM